MSLLPGLPTLPFMVLAATTGAVSWHLHKRRPMASTPEAKMKAAAGSGSATGTTPTGANAGAEKLESLLHLDALQIELGYGLVGLADKRKGGDLLDRVTGVRRTFAQDTGVIVPPIRLRDNLHLAANEYRFLLKGNPIAQGQLMPGYWLAMNATNSRVILKGVPTVEPVFQLPATWITDVERKEAEVNGFTVVDAASVLVTHLSETVKRHAHEILSRQDVQLLLDNLKQTHPTVVNELVPAQLSVGHIQRILQNLLAEGLSIRNLAGILEKVGDYATVTKNPDELSECARKALGNLLAKPFQSESGSLRAITLDPKLEQQIANGMRHTQNEVSLLLDPNLARHVINYLSKHIQQMLSAGQPPLVLCAPQIRLAFRRFFETTFADLNVLAYTEIPSRVEIQSSAVVPFPE